MIIVFFLSFSFSFHIHFHFHFHFHSHFHFHFSIASSFPYFFFDLLARSVHRHSADQIGTSVEEKLQHLRVSLHRRPIERCIPVVVGEVGIGTSAEEKLHHLRVSLP